MKKNTIIGIFIISLIIEILLALFIGYLGFLFINAVLDKNLWQKIMESEYTWVQPVLFRVFLFIIFGLLYSFCVLIINKNLYKKIAKKIKNSYFVLFSVFLFSIIFTGLIFGIFYVDLLVSLFFAT